MLEDPLIQRIRNRFSFVLHFQHREAMQTSLYEQIAPGVAFRPVEEKEKKQPFDDRSELQIADWRIKEKLCSY